MSGERQPSLWRRWPDGLRWAACFALVLGAHATAAGALIGHWRAEDDSVAGGPVILIELAPVAAAPEAPVSEAAPGPQQTSSPPEPQPEPQPEKTETPDQPTVTTTVAPMPEPPVEKTEPPPMPQPPLPQVQAVLPDVVMPPPRPRPPEKIKERKHPHRLADLNSAPTRTERRATHAMAPAPGAASNDPNALPNWKSALVARLERYKRYPSEAEARGEHGVAQLAFSVDRGGNVHNARIVRSSGSSALDRATLALIERAQPLPPPPPEIHGAQIAIVVPIRYNLH
jgi:protein TonB